MSRLVVNEAPMMLLPKLAAKIGLNESIFIQQLYYWLKESNHVHDGQRWVYNTYEGWHEQFPFWSISTIRRIIAKLEQEQLIISGNYNRLKLDKTKWYRINYEALAAIYDDEEMLSPVVHNEEEMSITSTQDEPYDASKWTAEETVMNTPIPEITTEITSEKEEVKETHAKRKNPFEFFEQNGFGTIGGYIAEKISSWCMDLSEELVLEAMKLAVENGSKTWRYVEAILRDWASKGYQTVDEVQAAQLEFTEKIARKKHKPSPNHIGRDIPTGFQIDLCAGEDDEE
ncbi:DnaD domain protein [Bacillus sp. B15-48]|uniref:DnaD domain-containing protein n=1 Tax=Bacillus sp. B15-48 TaxID=1548601 RepID=UPI00193F8445|nr:DnaD domain protein [Bacillus sp. B15-48]MBM4764717.1 DnaD domain protein [Bacillus sp. B15-48]